MKRFLKWSNIMFCLSIGPLLNAVVNPSIDIITMAAMGIVCAFLLRTIEGYKDALGECRAAYWEHVAVTRMSEQIVEQILNQDIELVIRDQDGQIVFQDQNYDRSYVDARLYIYPHTKESEENNGKEKKGVGVV